MKKYFLILIIACGAFLMGCKKINDPEKPEPPCVDCEPPCEDCEPPCEDCDDEDRSQLWDDADGSVWVNDNPDIDIDSKDEYPEERETLDDINKDLDEYPKF